MIFRANGHVRHHCVLLTLPLLTLPFVLGSFLEENPNTSEGLSPTPTQTTAVAREEFDCMRLKFQEHFKLKFGDVYANIPVADQAFSVASYEVARDALNCATGQLKGLVMHYGLTEDLLYQPEFSFVCLTEVGGTGVYEYDLANSQFYKVEAGQLVVSQNDEEGWYGTDGPWARYLAKVWVKRDADSDPVPCTNDDGRYIVHPVPRIDQLIADNNLGQGEVAVFPFAEPGEKVGGEDKDFRHMMCVAGWQDEAPLVDDDVPPSNTPFLGKAADLASICPTKCGRAEFPETGITSNDCQ